MSRKLQRRYKGSKRRREREGSPAPKHNPPLTMDLVEFIGPGFAGFAASRFVSYVASTQISKRAPSWGKHAGAGAAVGTFLAAWLLANKWKWLAKYQMPLIVGSGIAALQTLVQLYIPRVGWMVSDASPQLDTSAAEALTAAPAAPTLPAGVVPTDDDPALYTYNDSYDPGRMSSSPRQSHTDQAPTDDDLSDLIDEANQQQSMGVFSQ